MTTAPFWFVMGLGVGGVVTLIFLRALVYTCEYILKQSNRNRTEAGSLLEQAVRRNDEAVKRLHESIEVRNAITGELTKMRERLLDKLNNEAKENGEEKSKKKPEGKGE